MAGSADRHDLDHTRRFDTLAGLITEAIPGVRVDRTQGFVTSPDRSFTADLAPLMAATALVPPAAWPLLVDRAVSRWSTTSRQLAQRRSDALPTGSVRVRLTAPDRTISAVTRRLHPPSTDVVWELVVDTGDHISGVGIEAEELWDRAVDRSVRRAIDSSVAMPTADGQPDRSRAVMSGPLTSALLLAPAKLARQSNTGLAPADIEVAVVSNTLLAIRRHSDDGATDPLIGSLIRFTELSEPRFRPFRLRFDQPDGPDRYRAVPGDKPVLPTDGPGWVQSTYPPGPVD